MFANIAAMTEDTKASPPSLPLWSIIAGLPAVAGAYSWLNGISRRPQRIIAPRTAEETKEWEHDLEVMSGGSAPVVHERFMQFLGVFQIAGYRDFWQRDKLHFQDPTDIKVDRNYLALAIHASYCEGWRIAHMHHAIGKGPSPAQLSHSANVGEDIMALLEKNDELRAQLDDFRLSNERWSRRETERAASYKQLQDDLAKARQEIAHLEEELRLKNIVVSQETYDAMASGSPLPNVASCSDKDAKTKAPSDSPPCPHGGGYFNDDLATSCPQGAPYGIKDKTCETKGEG